ncbi:hypothetical protein DSM104299_03575 [Baekduia alba]|uniref:hypothetical protein n=1 Tax=Baekduia alba TaxID=2997333 RepID=UPI002341B17F|nr:hypothetical protein [Baekduia alba]WCB94836.1 hypothetical protein DSM104299_03575 [Baekduia alba]
MRKIRRIRLRRREWDAAILDVLTEAKREGDGWMTVLDIWTAAARNFCGEGAGVDRLNLGSSFWVSLWGLEDRGLIEKRYREGDRFSKFRIIEQGEGPRGRRTRRAPRFSWPWVAVPTPGAA